MSLQPSLQPSPIQNLLQTGELTRPRVPQVQLELPLNRPPHLKNRTRLKAVELTRLKLRPREVREPSRISGLEGVETVYTIDGLLKLPQVEVVDDPMAVVEVKNELTGQAWRFKDIGSMYGPDGHFMLRGQWPPGLYRIENRTVNGLRLTLWNETHDIAPGETWRFFAHSELGRKAELIERRRMN